LFFPPKIYLSDNYRLQTYPAANLTGFPLQWEKEKQKSSKLLFCFGHIHLLNFHNQSRKYPKKGRLAGLLKRDILLCKRAFLPNIL
jgi:hypothetical protein